MSTPSHPEDAPLNDTPEAKDLAPDPLLQAVAQLAEDARRLGLSPDDAQASAWAGVNKKREGPSEKVAPRPPRPEMSVGG